MIKHVENTLKHKDYYTKDTSQILSTIEEDQEDSETEIDECEEAEASINDSDLYAGFDEDGNRITEKH